MNKSATENDLRKLRNIVASYKPIHDKPIEINLSKRFNEFGSLHKLPTDIFEEIGYNLHKINMDNLRLISLNNIFNECYRLNEVSLTNNNIIYLDENVFKNCIYLSKINISFNHIEYVPQNLFINLWNLVTVDFRNNRILNLPANLFGHCPNLKQLNFEQNQLINIPDNLLHSKTKLTFLNIYNNKQLIKLPEQLLNACSTLQALFADMHVLYNIIDYVDDLDKLQSQAFFIYDNNIENNNIKKEVLSYIKNTCIFRRNKYDGKSYGWHIRKYAIISLVLWPLGTGFAHT